jgi:RES domain
MALLSGKGINLALKKPTKAFGDFSIKPTALTPDKLLRISRHSNGEPYFGRSGANRFDDYRKRKPFGACYFGLTLNVAFAETVLHDEMPVRGGFEIAVEELENRYVVSFTGKPLHLLDLTGHTLTTLGIDPSLSTIIPYDLTQQWSVGVHQHKDQYDGFMYMSRHMNTEKAIVLFDRAEPKIEAVSYVQLPNYPGALQAAMNFKLRFK